MGCALPLFLALVGTAVASGGPSTAAVAFILYGAGMGTVLCSLTLIAGTMSFGILSRVAVSHGWFPGWARFSFSRPGRMSSTTR